MGSPGRVYLNCLEIFNALDEEESIPAKLEAGH